MISVLVPYRADGGHRDRAWEFNQQRWAMLAPDTEIVVQEAPAGSDSGDFNHPWAINRAAERAAGDVFIVADADTTFDPGWVTAAAAALEAGARWVLPRYYDHLTEEATERLLRRGDPADIVGDYDIEWRGDSICWSGLVCVPREAFELVGGYDERWTNWGGDDVAFACTVSTLWGEVTRIDGAAKHLWHPRTGLDQQLPQHDELMRRYLDAWGDTEKVRDVRFGS
jgi:hypothetical protein